MDIRNEIRRLEARVASLQKSAGSDPARLSYLPRAQRDLAPSTVIRDIGLEYWSWEDQITGRPHLLAFLGKSNKPAVYSYYTSVVARDAALKQLIASATASAKMKQDRAQARKEFRHTLKVGDILYSSWGYDQTNIDWYQVTAVSDKAVVIREIQGKVVSSDGHGGDKVVPVPGKFIGTPEKKIPGTGNRIRLTSYSSAFPWDGKPRHETSPNWGH